VKQRKHGNAERDAPGGGPKQRRLVEMEQKRLELAPERTIAMATMETIVVLTAITM
jgi:hypothetical protein